MPRGEFRLLEMLRENLLESIPPAALAEHAAQVAAKREDPYAAIAALRANYVRGS